MRKTEDCSAVQYLLGKGLELQIKETAYFCSISIFSISVLCVCGGGETIRAVPSSVIASSAMEN